MVLHRSVRPVQWDQPFPKALPGQVLFGERQVGDRVSPVAAKINYPPDRIDVTQFGLRLIELLTENSE